MSFLKRSRIQYAFLVFNIYIGARFYLFVRHYETGGAVPFFSRPPSVEAYLPIASLIGLRHLLLTGVFDPVHPAALAIFLAITVSTLVLRRGFCSWICPIGTISELSHKLGARVMVNLKPHKFIDILLRVIKYLLLIFFVYSIAGMNESDTAAFISSPFNRLADVKMLQFFLRPSTTAIAILTSLFLLSLVIKNFWCRYLCPYGALLGLLSKSGLVRVARDAKACTDCGRCEKSCPSYINITKTDSVRSAECIMCADCVNACRENKALSIKAVVPKIRLKPAGYGLALVGFFLIFILSAQATGHWRTNISPAVYETSIPDINSSIYGHP